jgi:hypothetical protein
VVATVGKLGEGADRVFLTLTTDLPAFYAEQARPRLSWALG